MSSPYRDLKPHSRFLDQIIDRFVYATVEEAEWDDCAENDVHSAAFERPKS